MLIALQGAVSQGVLWGIMVLGVFITFRLLDIPDMTCDGSFALGGCVCAVLIVNNDVDPLLAVLAGMCAGAIAGAVTGILTTVFEIPAILAGILTQISLCPSTCVSWASPTRPSLPRALSSRLSAT